MSNVLFVSNDPSVFDEKSVVRARMREYATHVGALHILSQAKPGSTFVQEQNLFLHPIHTPRLITLLTLQRNIRALCQAHAIDVVSAQDPFEHGYLAMKALEGTPIPLHIQIHTDFLSPWFVRAKGFRASHVHLPLFNRLRVQIADRVLPHAKGIRVVSKRIADSLHARYGTSIVKSTVIPIAVPDTLPPPVSLPPHTFTFTFITVSRLEAEKRIEDIFFALARIRFHYGRVGLFVVGSGKERGHLERLAHSLGLADSVVFLGERTDAVALMQSANAYIQASAYEGYSRTLLEAALARIPIVTTDVGIVGEVFSGYTDVLAVPVADPVALSVAMRGLLDDHQARVTLVMNALHKAQEHLYTMSVSAEKIMQDVVRAGSEVHY